MRKLKFHCLQHVAFEGPGIIESWAKQQGHSFHFTRFYLNEKLPQLNEVDVLIVMGGPMSFDDDAVYHWMPTEKAFIKTCMDAGKSALGICLGAQMIAIAAGGEGQHGSEQEVGWFPIQFFNTDDSFSFLPKNQTVFHWHGDTFTIPPKAVHFAGTDAFPNQGFLLNSNIVGLQFHLEIEPNSVQAMIDHVGDQIPDQRFTQSPEKIVLEDAYYQNCHQLLLKILADIVGNTQ